MLRNSDIPFFDMLLIKRATGLVKPQYLPEQVAANGSDSPPGGKVVPMEYAYRDGFTAMADAEKSIGVDMACYLDSKIMREQRTIWVLTSQIETGHQTIDAVLGNRSRLYAVHAKRKVDTPAVQWSWPTGRWSVELAAITFVEGSVRDESWPASEGTKPGGWIDAYVDHGGFGNAPRDEFSQLPAYLQKHVHEAMPPQTRRLQWGSALGGVGSIPERVWMFYASDESVFFAELSRPVPHFSFVGAGVPWNVAVEVARTERIEQETTRIGKR